MFIFCAKNYLAGKEFKEAREKPSEGKNSRYKQKTPPGPHSKALCDVWWEGGFKIPFYRVNIWRGRQSKTRSHIKEEKELWKELLTWYWMEGLQRKIFPPPTILIPIWRCLGPPGSRLNSSSSCFLLPYIENKVFFCCLSSNNFYTTAIYPRYKPIFMVPILSPWYALLLCPSSCSLL